jgi:toxin ParE1/3/4
VPQYRLTEAALADLDVIWLYVAEHGGIETADRFIDTIMERFPLLATYPGLGREREELAPNLLSFPMGEYLIFYRRAGDGIDIVRVLHGSRDLPRLFMH